MTLVLWLELALFTATVLSVALYGLSASGHFPSEHRAAVLRSGGGAALLWGTMALALAAAVVALRFAWIRLPLPAAVIAGGFAVLFAPLLLQPLPDRFVDGRRALAIFAGLAAALAVAGWSRLA